MIADGSITNVVAQSVIWLLLLVVIVVVIQRVRRERLQKRQRGFEVKLNTGQAPVTEKKDENHG